MESLDIVMRPTVRSVTIPEGVATFTCYAPGHPLLAAHWLLNNTRLENSNFPNITMEIFDIHETINVSILALRHIPLEWNNTVLQCVGNYSRSGQDVVLGSNECTLILQGI